MMEMEIFNEDMQVAVFTPLDALFAEYRKDREALERISAYILQESGGVSGHFVSANILENNANSVSIMGLFQIEPAIRSLDAEYWSRAMSLTDVLEMMDASKRNEWAEQIRKHQTPAFEQESVAATMRQLLNMRAHFMTQRIDGLFRSLSGEHVTNVPQGFSKRMIIDFMLDSYGHVVESRSNFVHDLRCILAKFTGRDTPVGRVTYFDLNDMVKEDAYGEWRDFDGGAYRVKLFKKGTAHLEIHPEMAVKLNQVLASLYPNAIPESFRRKPVKTERVKEFALSFDLLSFKVIECIRSARLNCDGNQIRFDHSVSIPKDVLSVLERLGGVQNGVGCWLFDYDVSSVLKTMYRTGGLPEQRSHQFYPTPSSIADVVVELAEIDMTHSVLEPEAGQGGLADRLPNRDMVTCIEISQLHCDILMAKGYKHVKCANFLIANRDWVSHELFDRIVMNPPFSEGRALSHLKHAAGMLKPGGILVAVLPASLKWKELIPGASHCWSDTYSGEFEDTGVSVSILKIQK